MPDLSRFAEKTAAQHQTMSLDKQIVAAISFRWKSMGWII
jgi:hypothetical protein